jgi:hypothetical protein
VAAEDETAAAVERAQRALLELRARAVAEERAVEERRRIEKAHQTQRHQEATAAAELGDG